MTDREQSLQNKIFFQKELIELKTKAIKDLEKENAELREKCEKLEQGYVWHDYDVGEDTYEDTHEGRWVKRDEAQKLEKAEKIIKELLDTQVQLDLYRSVFKERILRAEEFLKDLEQPKMFAFQVPAPEPPKMETVSEDYKPFSLLKEEITDTKKEIKENG